MRELQLKYVQTKCFWFSVLPFHAGRWRFEVGSIREAELGDRHVTLQLKVCYYRVIPLLLLNIVPVRIIIAFECP